MGFILNKEVYCDDEKRGLKMITIGIVGAGETGAALLEVFHTNGEVSITGITDRDKSAQGIALAKERGIFIARDIDELLKQGPNIVINATGDPEVYNVVRKTARYPVEVIESKWARFLWEHVRRQQSASYLKAVFDGSGDMILTTDTEGWIVRFSKGGERILGYSENELIGRKSGDLYVDRTERTKLLKILEERGIITDYETKILKKDGTPVDISLTISKLRDGLGNIIGTVDVIKEITIEKQLRAVEEQLRMELRQKNTELTELNEKLEEKVLERTKELEKLNRELNRANQVKSKFISSMSHELRTPLHSILGFSELLLDKTFGNLNEKQEKQVLGIYTSGKHQLQLVNNILDLAKIEAGKIDLFYGTFPMKDVIDEVTVIMKSLSGKKSITISATIASEVTEFTADRVKLKQILYNLLSNAVKFTPEGGRIGVDIKRVRNVGGAYPWALEGQSLLEMSVWDTGIGIKEEDKERIFDEFEQASSSYGGTGLGLSLTKKLVELHGGHIDVESQYGSKSTFRVYLPYTAEVVEMKKPVIPEPETEVLSWMREDAPEILIIEDDHATSEILTIHLAKAGYRVSHAYDGLEGIEKAKQLKPFAIILDIMLPKLDGWEVLQRLKTDSETVKIPVITHSVVNNKELAFALGATDYILKPVDKDLFLSRLGEISLIKKKERHPVSVMLLSKDTDTIDTFHNLLTDAGLLLHAVMEKDEVIELSAKAFPNAIVIDAADNLELASESIRAINANPVTKGIPVFLYTARELTPNERMLFAGQIEHILKKESFSIPELITHLREMEVLFPKRAGLIDELTGVFNHRYLQLRLAQEVQRWVRYKTPLVFLLMDIDNFGHYLSNKGNYYGNLVLKKMAELLRKNIRGTDVLARYGGDEFGLILSNTMLSSAQHLCKRFSTMIREYPFIHEEVQPKGKITISIGMVEYKGDAAEDLLRCTTNALNHAKEEGGDRIKTWKGGQNQPPFIQL